MSCLRREASIGMRPPPASSPPRHAIHPRAAAPGHCSSLPTIHCPPGRVRLYHAAATRRLVARASARRGLRSPSAGDRSVERRRGQKPARGQRPAAAGVARVRSSSRTLSLVREHDRRALSAATARRRRARPPSGRRLDRSGRGRRRAGQDMTSPPASHALSSARPAASSLDAAPFCINATRHLGGGAAPTRSRERPQVQGLESQGFGAPTSSSTTSNARRRRVVGRDRLWPELRDRVAHERVAPGRTTSPPAATRPAPGVPTPPRRVDAHRSHQARPHCENRSSWAVLNTSEASGLRPRHRVGHRVCGARGDALGLPAPPRLPSPVPPASGWRRPDAATSPRARDGDVGASRRPGSNPAPASGRRRWAGRPYARAPRGPVSGSVLAHSRPVDDLPARMAGRLRAGSIALVARRPD